MAPIGILWGLPGQPQTRVILTIAALNDLELRQPEWSFINKPPEFTAKFPYGKIPALEFDAMDGFTLFEGVAIARYLCAIGTKVNILGSNKKESALIDQWVNFAEHEIGGPVHSILALIYGFTTPFSRETLDKLKQPLLRALKFLESYLETRSSLYLVSESATLADYVVAGAVSGACFAALGDAERSQYPNVFAHYWKVTDDGKIKKFWGTEEWANVAVTEPKPMPTS